MNTGSVNLPSIASAFPFYLQRRTWLRSAFDAAVAAGEVARLFSAQQDDLYYRVFGSEERLLDERRS